MTWQLQWGSQVDYLHKVEEETGETPMALLTRPTVENRLAYYLKAFDRCSASRQHGSEGQPLPISMNDVLAYCQFFAVDDLDMRERLLDHLQALDEVYLDLAAKRRAAADKVSKTAVAPALSGRR